MANMGDLQGLSIARMLHSRGAKISIADCNAENISAAPHVNSSASSNIMICELNVRDSAKVRARLEQIVQKFGRLGGAVNFAGIISHTMGLVIEDQEEGHWERTIGVSLTVSIPMELATLSITDIAPRA